MEKKPYQNDVHCWTYYGVYILSTQFNLNVTNVFWASFLITSLPYTTQIQASN